MGTRKLISKAVNAVATDYIGEDGELWVDTVSNLMKINNLKLNLKILLIPITEGGT